MALNEDLMRLIRERWRPDDEFALEDVYEFVPRLEALYPGNTSIQGRIPKVLEGLRDEGKIDSVDNWGNYRLPRDSALSQEEVQRNHERKFPPTTKENIEAALKRFDMELRPRPEYSNWEDRGNQQYAIMHQKRLYPVKEIISFINGLSRTDFTGGQFANRYIERYGFRVAPISLLRKEIGTETQIKWWVNPGPTFKQERTGGYLWAPKSSRGRIVYHDTNVNAMSKGDRVLHYLKGNLRAISTVISSPTEAPRPVELGDRDWGDEGYMVKVEYKDLDPPIALESIPRDWRVAERRGVFNRVGGVNQGYLFPLPTSFSNKMLGRFPQLGAESVTEQAASWIFRANPDRYDLSSALGRIRDLSWLVSQHKDKIHRGDRVYLWIAGASGGLVARGSVDSEPGIHSQQPEEMEFWVGEEDTSTQLRVRIHIADVLRSPISRSVVQETEGLEHLSILRFAQGTNFSVDGDESVILDQLIDDALETPRPNARYWAIAPGEGARLWNDFQESSIIAIGWDQIGDLRQYASKSDVGDAIKQSRESEQEPINDALACREFLEVMKPGDAVLAKRGISEVIGYGIVEGEYHYEAARAEYRNVRRVRWVSTGTWTLPDNIQLPVKTLTEVTGYTEFLDFILPLVREVSTTPPAASLGEPYSVDDALDGLFIDKAVFIELIRTLARKRNIVLQGPPGVGKTFIAKRIAYALMGTKDESRVQMVQFHQSYSYEDFVQGWRPTQQGFELRDGVFYKFCRQAADDNGDRSHVFIIDEINRANLSKVLGELMMLIEADKRGSEFAIPLTYSVDGTDKFAVPANVYIIGLMNTADRSLAMVDYALRRRFAFFPLEPGFANPNFRSFLSSRGVPQSLIDVIIDRVMTLNKEILADEKNLGRGFEIGHSFFCPQGTEATLDEDWYREIISSEIAPLLREYWFDNSEKASQWTTQLLP